MSGPALEARGLSIGYRRRGKDDIVLGRALELELWRGQLVGLLGPNGVGKSTLLRTLAGMRPTLAGRVSIGGRDIAALKPWQRARHLSLVLTDPPKPALLNGYALVCLGRQPHTDWLGRLTERDHATVAWALEAVDARDLAVQPVAELSDGQRQKLMIARALAQEAEVMLLDEPTAFLDLPRRMETMRLLQRLARSADRAILVSTHDLELALRACDRLWLMSEAGIAMGAPEDLALDGRLGATFQADGIRFDHRSGGFAPRPTKGKPARLRGQGKEAHWMRKALERAGYAPVEEPAAIEIGHDGEAGWQLRVNGSQSRHRTIQAVLDALACPRD